MTDESSSRLSAYTAAMGLAGKAVILRDVDELIDKLADDLTLHALETVKQQGVFHLALSGGSTPQRLYRRLVIDPAYRIFPWGATHVWIVDERCVSFDDDRSNWRMIRELLVDHVPLIENHVHHMPVDRVEGDRAYEADLRRHVRDGALDHILLGMGDDGHTASLFPHSPALAVSNRWVALNDGDTVTPPQPRMTLTFPLINAAHRISVLVTGAAKRGAIQRISLAQRFDPALPITGIQPIRDESQLTWYLDDEAVRGQAE